MFLSEGQASIDFIAKNDNVVLPTNLKQPDYWDYCTSVLYKNMRLNQFERNRLVSDSLASTLDCYIPYDFVGEIIRDLKVNEYPFINNYWLANSDITMNKCAACPPTEFFWLKNYPHPLKREEVEGGGVTPLAPAPYLKKILWGG